MNRRRRPLAARPPVLSLYWRTTLLMLATLLGVLLIWFASQFLLNHWLRPQQFTTLLQQQIALFEQKTAEQAGTNPLLLDWPDGVRLRPATPRMLERNAHHLERDPMAADLSQRLGNRPVHIRRHHDNIPAVAIALAHDGQHYWLIASTDGVDPARQSWWWLTLGGLSLLLVIGVSLWMTGWITRALAGLAQAAATLEQGRFPAPLAEVGPRELRAVTRQFNRMSQTQAAQQRDLEFLLGAVSHDLRTPLSRMRVELAMIDDPAARTGLSGDVDQMQAIIEQFLDYVRNGGRTNNGRVALDDFLAGLLADHQRGGLAIEGQWPTGLVIEADVMILRRLLDNLISNAAQHGRPPIRLSVAVDQRRLVLRVCDRGNGIPLEEQERLTRPFETGSEARGDRHRSGLGLAIAKRGAQALGGLLEFERNTDAFCVVVRLPLPAEQSAERSGQQSQMT